jgi:hypothetical protein
MKKTLTLSYVMLGMILCLSLVSCGDDANEKLVEDMVVANSQYATLKYGVVLSQVWYDYFNIEVSYIDINGTQSTTVIRKDWTYASSTVKTTEAGDAFGITVIAKPKSDDPAVASGAYYNLTENCYMNFNVLDSYGRVIKQHNKASSTGISLGNDNAARFFSTEQEVFSTSYEM